MINNIPKELAELPQWCYTVANSKRPRLSVNNVSRAKPLALLTDTSAQIGIILSGSNDYTIIDIDADEAIKAQLAFGKSLEELQQQLLQQLPHQLKQLIHQSYSEWSLSGLGIHVVLKTNKEQAIANNRAYIKLKDIKGQVSFTRNFMVMTGYKLDESPNSIADIDIWALDIMAHNAESSNDNEISSSASSQNVPALIESLPTIHQVTDAINVCPLDQNPRVQEVYRAIIGAEYEHYNYWLTIAMALHDYAQKTSQNARVYSLFLTWSMQDVEAFTGEEDCEAKWKSFANHTNNISYKTLFKFASLLEFNYPKTIIKNGKATGTPISTEYANFEYLMAKFNIELYEEDNGAYYLRGDQDILAKYFISNGANILLGFLGPLSRQQLIAATTCLCQDCKYKALSSTQTLVDIWLAKPRKNVDFFNEWLDTPFENLPQEFKFDIAGRYFADYNHLSTFAHICKCINWNETEQDKELSEKMLYKTFMQLIKFHTPINTPFDTNGGMLAFIGPENAYKSTFFKMLLPTPLAFMHKELTMPVVSDKGIRDFIRYLGKKVIVQIDEFEGFLDQKKTGPILKSLISGNNMSITDIYQTSETTMARKAIVVATSNDRKHILSANGSRRMWMCEVNSIDTTNLLGFNWHYFYNQLRKEFNKAIAKGEHPWLMAHSETLQTTERNEKLAAKSDLDLMLENIFAYSDQVDYETQDVFETSELMYTLEVYRILMANGAHNVSMAALERSLERFCTSYTKSSAAIWTKYKGISCVISRGKIIAPDKLRDMMTSRKPKHYWVLPKLGD